MSVCVVIWEPPSVHNVTAGLAFSAGDCDGELSRNVPSYSVLSSECGIKPLDCLKVVSSQSDFRILKWII